MARHPALRTWSMPVQGQAVDMVAPPVRGPWDLGRFAPAPELGQHTEVLRREFAARPTHLDEARSTPESA
jgi:crotonobetainyl-CoA:carnitine CoA-transferase CaiB-like acyl-CoA transferase